MPHDLKQTALSETCASANTEIESIDADGIEARVDYLFYFKFIFLFHFHFEFQPPASVLACQIHFSQTSKHETRSSAAPASVT